MKSDLIVSKSNKAIQFSAGCLLEFTDQKLLDSFKATHWATMEEIE